MMHGPINIKLIRIDFGRYIIVVLRHITEAVAYKQFKAPFFVPLCILPIRCIYVFYVLTTKSHHFLKQP